MIQPLLSSDEMAPLCAGLAYFSTVSLIIVTLSAVASNAWGVTLVSTRCPVGSLPRTIWSAS
jgi:hypothetical protein